MLSLALILVLALPTILVSVPTVDAQDPKLEIPTYPLLTVNPNPVGVDQIVYINAFMSKPTPTAGMSSSGDQYEDIMIYITKPDGSEDTIGPLKSDSTGGTFASYMPTQVGSYEFQMKYPGGELKGAQDQFMGSSYNWTGSKLLPSESEIITLVVQEDPVESIYKTPSSPTEYWSRPIYATNWEWAKLGGSWFGLAAPAFATTGKYDATGNFQPYSTAPDTAHIMWTKPTHFGGQVGLPISNDQSSPYTSTSIAINHFEPVILNGILYYTKYASPSSIITGWEAVDLRTGETLWTRSAGDTGNEVIRMGQIFRFHTVQEFGSAAYLWACEEAGFFQQPSFYSLYDAMTGEWVANITDINNGPFLIDVDTEQQGTLLGYYTRGGNLTLWNSTRCITRGADTALTIRPSGTLAWDDGIEWSVPVANITVDGTPIAGSLSVAARTPEVILLRSAPSPASGLSYGYQITAGYDARTGELLWGPINQTLPEFQDISLIGARDGVYVLHNKDTNEAYGYSLEDGEELWGPVALQGNAWSHIQRAAEIAYGRIYIVDFGGYVNALDLQTGETEWTFTPRSSGYDAPYGVYPFWYNNVVADGKLFLSEGSMYNPPVHPAKRLAIDCETGELVWDILSYSGRVPAAIADGFMIEWNSLDCQIYTYGKGQTATTLSASPKVATAGNSILIEGKVIDESPGTKNPDRIARFPHGVPAIADESMTDWMEYVYMQQTKPTDACGVPVKLLVTGPDGVTEHIITVTSDINGFYHHQWRPPQEGTYTITAVFDGSDSYWGSSDITAVAVDAASAAPVEPAPSESTAPSETSAPTEAPIATSSPTVAPEPSEAAPDDTLLIVGAAAIIIVAVAAAALVLRKRQ